MGVRCSVAKAVPHPKLSTVSAGFPSDCGRGRDQRWVAAGSGRKLGVPFYHRSILGKARPTEAVVTETAAITGHGFRTEATEFDRVEDKIGLLIQRRAGGMLGIAALSPTYRAIALTPSCVNTRRDPSSSCRAFFGVIGCW